MRCWGPGGKGCERRLEASLAQAELGAPGQPCEGGPSRANVMRRSMRDVGFRCAGEFVLS
jgi:hypothetical protein